MVVLDVVDSTRAVDSGRYKEVNSVGVACIAALLNAVDRAPVPYVFGGDGATVLVPPDALARIRQAVRGLQRMARRGFGLELRAGIVPIADLVAAGSPVLVSRLRLSEGTDLPALAGPGVATADAWIRDPERAPRYAVDPDGSDEAADCSGFECRWRPVPAHRGRVVAVLVQAVSDDLETRRAAYRRVVSAILAVVGSLPDVRPTRSAEMRISPYLRDMRCEAIVLTGGRRGPARWIRALRTWFRAAVGRYLVRHGRQAGDFDGRRYVQDAAEQSDFWKFDGALRCVLDLTAPEHAALRARLEDLRQAGQVRFGTHASAEALLTCMVWNRTDGHLHFVDGADGGYARAALEVKAQLRRDRERPASACPP